MPTPVTRIRALLASLRIANAPSVASNVVLGFLLGAFLLGGVPPHWVDLGLLVASGLALFFAGNLANDWHDRDWDARHRPERALVTGAFRHSSYGIAALALGIGALGLAAAVGPVAVAVALTILASVAFYTRIHKRSPWGVVPMGLCRAGLYLLGAAGAIKQHREMLGWLAEAGPSTPLPGTSPLDFSHAAAVLAIHALGLFAYVVGLSLNARYESLADPPPGPRFLARASLLVPPLAMSCYWVAGLPMIALAGLLPYTLWLLLCLTRFRKPVPRLVSALLAGIPLVDFIAAAPLAFHLHPDPGPSLQPVSALALAVPLLAFAFARLLQRVAPAT